MQPTTKALEARHKRQQEADRGTREFVACIQTGRCLHEFAMQYCQPHPSLPGFPDQDPRQPDEHLVTHLREDPRIECRRVRPCCTSCANKLGQVNLPFDEDAVPPAPLPRAKGEAVLKVPKRPCPKSDRAELVKQISEWRGNEWEKIAKDQPYLTESWLLGDGAMKKIIEKANVLVAAQEVNKKLVYELTQDSSMAELQLSSLISVLNQWRTAFYAAHGRNGAKNVKYLAEDMCGIVISA